MATRLASLTAEGLLFALVGSLMLWRLGARVDRWIKHRLATDLEGTLTGVAGLLHRISFFTPRERLLRDGKTRDYQGRAKDSINGLRLFLNKPEKSEEEKAREVRVQVVKFVGVAIESWTEIDPILKAVFVAAPCSFIFLLAGTRLYGAMLGVTEMLVIVPLLIGAFALATQMWLPLLICMPVLVAEVSLVAATTPPNPDAIFQYLATALWLVGLPVVALAFALDFEAAFKPGMKILAAGFAFDLGACIFSLPPVARLSGVAFVSNGVTWSNVYPFIGDLIMTVVLFRRAKRGMKPMKKLILIGVAPDAHSSLHDR